MATTANHHFSCVCGAKRKSKPPRRAVKLAFFRNTQPDFLEYEIQLVAWVEFPVNAVCCQNRPKSMKTLWKYHKISAIMFISLKNKV